MPACMLNLQNYWMDSNDIWYGVSTLKLLNWTLSTCSGLVWYTTLFLSYHCYHSNTALPSTPLYSLPIFLLPFPVPFTSP